MTADSHSNEEVRQRVPVGLAPTANLRTKILDFRGFDSSRVLIFMGSQNYLDLLFCSGSPRVWLQQNLGPSGNFPEGQRDPSRLRKLPRRGSSAPAQRVPLVLTMPVVAVVPKTPFVPVVLTTPIVAMVPKIPFVLGQYFTEQEHISPKTCGWF